MSRRIIALATLITALLAFSAIYAADGGGMEVNWKTSWDDAQKAAKENGKLVFVLLTDPSWCRPCRMLESGALKDAEVTSMLNNKYVPLMLKGSKTAPYRSFSQAFGVKGIPSMLILDADKNLVVKRSGYMAAEAMVKFLGAAIELPELEKACEADAENLEAMKKLADCRFDLGQGRESKALYEKLVEKDADNAKGIKVHALYRLAMFDRGSKQYGEARKKLEEVKTLDAENTAGYKLKAAYALGNLELSLGNADAANKQFDEVLELDPEDKEGYKDNIAYTKAMAPAKTKDYKAVAENLEKFVKGYSASDLMPAALLNLANSYYLLKEYEKARPHYEKLVKDYPKTSQAKKAEAIMKRLPAPKDEPEKEDKEEEKKDSEPEKGKWK